MAADTILQLGEISTADEQRIGQKAATLNRLMGAGFPVPDGICIPVDAFLTAKAHFAHQIDNLLASPGLDDPSRASEAASRIAPLLKGLAIPAAVLEASDLALQSWGEGPMAVRSSATLEDLPTASFAGQYESILGITGAQNIQEAVLACWKSWYSANAIAARSQFLRSAGKGLKDQEGGMGVLIQPLLVAECAGVCFTVDPLSLDPAIITVASTWGLGTGIVDGSVPADVSHVRRTDLRIEKISIADKPVCMRAGPAGGLQRVPVTEEQQKSACLPLSWLQRVAQFGLAAEQALGRPQDLEWAVAGQQVWVLQSRPITTLPTQSLAAVQFPVEWANERESRRYWWLERFHDWPETTLLPITLDFIKARTEGGWQAVAYGGSAETRWRKYVHGRVFIARAASPLDLSAQEQRAAAFKSEMDGLEEQSLTLWDYWGLEIERTTERLGVFNPENAGGEALAEHLEQALAAAVRHWMIHTLVPRRLPIARLVEAYRQIGGRDGPEAEDELLFLTRGEETIHTRLIEAIYDLAQLAGQRPALVRLLSTRPPGMMILLSEMPEARDFLAGFKRLLAEFGGRLCGRPLSGFPATLPVPWREAPEHVLAMVAVYLPQDPDAPVDSPRQHRERVQRQTQDRLAALYSKAQNPAAAARFQSRLEYARRNEIYRDQHNHYIDQLAEGQFMQAVIYAGRWLARRGDLAQAEDACWLETEEILSALYHPDKQDLSATVVERQRQFGRWSKRIAPASLGLPEPGLPEREQEKPFKLVAKPAEQDAKILPENTLTGQAGSPGTGSGPACLAPETTALPDVARGDVLVAENAGPLWTPVLASLAGIVLEEGSLAEHIAIMAREYGIPAVMNVSEATQRIPPGAQVVVDGTNGVVAWE